MSWNGEKGSAGPAGERFKNFERRLVNRRVMPTRHIVVCEDDLSNQREIASHFATVFDPQGYIQISYVCGGLAAAGILYSMTVNLVILDHDMPDGSGSDLLEWMKNEGYEAPVITFSGIQSNNEILRTLGAEHIFSKRQVIDGEADSLIQELLDEQA